MGQDHTAFRAKAPTNAYQLRVTGIMKAVPALRIAFTLINEKSLPRCSRQFQAGRAVDLGYRGPENPPPPTTPILA
jgi:hypothetical protein